MEEKYSITFSTDPIDWGPNEYPTDPIDWGPNEYPTDPIDWVMLYMLQSK
jgi:hypothetical protein